MGETIKRLKVNMILSALVCAALGAVLLLWPAQTLDIFCKILAVGLIVIGAVQLTGYFMNRSLHPFAAPLGVIVLLVGIWIFIRPESIVSLVPIVIGVMLCVHGIQDVGRSRQRITGMTDGGAFLSSRSSAWRSACSVSSMPSVS